MVVDDVAGIECSGNVASRQRDASLGKLDRRKILDAYGLGDPVRMLEFKLSKTSKQTLAAEKSKFHEKKPHNYKRKGSENLA